MPTSSKDGRTATASWRICPPKRIVRVACENGSSTGVIQHAKVTAETAPPGRRPAKPQPYESRAAAIAPIGDVSSVTPNWTLAFGSGEPCQGLMNAAAMSGTAEPPDVAPDASS